MRKGLRIWTNDPPDTFEFNRWFLHNAEGDTCFLHQEGLDSGPVYQLYVDHAEGRIYPASIHPEAFPLQQLTVKIEISSSFDTLAPSPGQAFDLVRDTLEAVAKKLLGERSKHRLLDVSFTSCHTVPACRKTDDEGILLFD